MVVSPPRLVGLLAVLVASATTVEARASEPEAAGDEAGVPAEAGAEPTLTGDVEVGIFAERGAEADVASLSPLLHLGIRPRPQVELFGGFGVVATFSDSEAGRQNLVGASNIGFGVRGVTTWGEDKFRQARIGFQFALPTAFAPTPEEEQAYEYALGGRAGWNPWEWAPQTLGLVVPADLRAQVLRRLVVGADVGLGGLFASVDNQAAPAFAGQVAAQVRWVLPWLALGLRVSGVYNGRAPDDRTQAAVTPMADVSLCRRGGPRLRGTMTATTPRCPVYATARFNVNLDEPYGVVGSDAMRVWGLQLGLGWGVF